jgi:hypothetical protein
VQRYPIRASHRKELTAARLDELCRTHFGSATTEGNAIVASYGAIVRLKVWVEAKELAVDLTMNPKVDVTVAAETVRRYNRFLEESTGFTSKERAKKLRKSAASPDAGD